MVELTLKERKMKALRWNDNCSDMKHFCGNQCTITYETCSVDDYWLLKVYDSIKNKEVIVPNGDYVIEYDDNYFTVMDTTDIKFWFKPGFEINGVAVEPKVENDEDCESNTNSVTTEENDILWKRSLMEDLVEENKYQ